MKQLTKEIDKNLSIMDRVLNYGSALGIKKNVFSAKDRRCCYYYLDGIVDPYRLVWLQYALQAQRNEAENLSAFTESGIAAIEYKIQNELSQLVEAVMKGNVVLLVDGFEGAVILDMKKPPSRGIQEPDKSKTLRGPHDGFCENLILNVALIRRRIRSVSLEMISYEIGEETQTDVVMLYLKGKAENKTVKELDRRLKSIRLNALCMTQEALAEQIVPQTRFSRWNPFPKVRFTERPDTASAMLLEGKILILCDNTPAAIVLPVSVFDFFEETDDYYFPLLTGTYMRIVRLFVFIATVYLAPLWLWATKNTDVLPSLLHFVGKIEGEYTLPLFVQLLIIEFAIDGLKLASLNTPSSLSGSLSIVGGLLLGDFAVKSGWFIPQTILYSAFTAMANFVPSNLELGYSFKFLRILLIVFTQIGGLAGLISGSLLFLIILFFTKSVDGKSYCYPLFPLDAKALKKILLRTPKGREEKE